MVGCGAAVQHVAGEPTATAYGPAVSGAVETDHSNRDQPHINRDPAVVPGAGPGWVAYLVGRAAV